MIKRVGYPRVTSPRLRGEVGAPPERSDERAPGEGASPSTEYVVFNRVDCRHFGPG